MKSATEFKETRNSYLLSTLIFFKSFSSDSFFFFSERQRIMGFKMTWLIYNLFYFLGEKYGEVQCNIPEF